MADDSDMDYTMMTVQLLSAYVANNLVPSNELAALIQSTRAALVAQEVQAAPETPEYVPAVSIRKSIASPDHILSLIDGRPYKTLKRHLATHGLTPDTYRERFGLPKSYPMVAAGYSEQRRAVAQKIGLGQRGLAAQALASGGSAKADAAPKTPRKSRASAANAQSPTTQASPAAPKARTRSKPAAKVASEAGPAAGMSKTEAAPASAPASKAKTSAATSKNAKPAATRKKLGIRTTGRKAGAKADA